MTALSKEDIKMFPFIAARVLAHLQMEKGSRRNVRQHAILSKLTTVRAFDVH